MQNQSAFSTQQQLLRNNRNYRWLWIGQTISTLGDAITSIAIPIYIYELTGSAAQLGLAFLAQTLPSLFFGLIAGVLSDMWNRKRTMIVSDILRAVLVACIPLLAVLNLSQGSLLIGIYILAFLIGAIKLFFLPAKIATIPVIVNEGELVTANSLDQASHTFMNFIGYVSGGALISLVGANWAFGLDSLTYLLSALCIMMINATVPLRQAKTTVRSVWEGVLIGLRFVWQVPLLRGTLFLSLLGPLAIGAGQPLLVVYAKEVLQASNFEFGLLIGSAGIGVTIGMLLLGKYGKSMGRWQMLTWGAVGTGMANTLAIGSPLGLVELDVERIIIYVVSLVFFFLAAIANASIFLGIRTISQENAPRDMVGRVFNVIHVASNTMITFGAATSGLADIWGVGRVFLFWGVFLTIVGLIGWIFLPHLRQEVDRL